MRPGPNRRTRAILSRLVHVGAIEFFPGARTAVVRAKLRGLRVPGTDQPGSAPANLSAIVLNASIHSETHIAVTTLRIRFFACSDALTTAGRLIAARERYAGTSHQLPPSSFMLSQVSTWKRRIGSPGKM